MGIKKLPEIVALFKKERGEKEPIALIQHGSLEHQKTVVGNLGNILESQTKNGLGSPVIIVIGEVVLQGMEHCKKRIREEIINVEG
jgi:uroporphyrin-III C-methyltransferase